MFIRRAVALMGLLGVTALAGSAQEPSVESSVAAVARSIARGTAAANQVPASFRAQLVVDNRFKLPVKNADGSESPDPRNRTGKIHCLVCEYGLSPMVAIFVRGDVKSVKDTDGLSKLIKGTDTLIPKYRGDKLGAFAMFLNLEGGTKAVTVKTADGGDEKIEANLEYPDDEDRDAKAADVKAYFGRVKNADNVNADNVPFGLSPATSTSITAFAIGDNTPVTVIIYNRLRIVQRWELKMDELTDEKVSEILNAVEAMVRGK